MLYKSSKRKVNEPLVRSAPNGLYFKGICFLMLKVKIIDYKGGNPRNPYKQLQLDKKRDDKLILFVIQERHSKQEIKTKLFRKC